jgi:hypothetical protein
VQKAEALYKAHRLDNVPPPREAELREVVSRPAKLLSARFETDRLAATIAQRTAEESTKDVGALPLLSDLLDLDECGRRLSSAAIAFSACRSKLSNSAV